VSIALEALPDIHYEGNLGMAVWYELDFRADNYLSDGFDDNHAPIYFDFQGLSSGHSSPRVGPTECHLGYMDLVRPGNETLVPFLRFQIVKLVWSITSELVWGLSN
jgi:hypothetical protein